MLGPALLLTLLSSLTATARADDDQTSPVYRYGYQTAIMDVAAAGILTTGLLMDEPWVYGTGGVAYLIGGPMVHLAQKNHDGLATSGVLRVGVPLLFGLAGAAITEIADGDRDGNTLVRLAPGLLIGALLTAVIDAEVLARRPPRSGDPIGMRAVPLLTRRVAGGALVGTF